MNTEEELLKAAISILEQTKTVIENKKEPEDYLFGRPIKYWPDKYLEQCRKKLRKDGIFGGALQVISEELGKRKEHKISVVELEEK